MFKDILKCKRCDLVKTRRKNCVVIGRGVVPADILFIGEAPGSADEILRKPLVGQAGRLLDEMIIRAGIINIKYYITNIVLCRPVGEKFAQNRPPSKIEIIKCTQNIMQIYKAVQPQAVIFMDKLALDHYKKEFNSTFTIMNPKWHVNNGGDKSPRYLTDVQTLREVFKCVK